MKSVGAQAAAGVLWALAGGGWVAQAFLPWTTRGTLSSASPLDAVRLVRAGILDGAIQVGSTVALLSLPAVGVGVIGLAGFEGRGVRIARAWLLAVAVAVVLGTLHVLTGARPVLMSDGAWTALAAVGCAVAALVVGRRDLSRRTDEKEMR